MIVEVLGRRSIAISLATCIEAWPWLGCHLEGVVQITRDQYKHDMDTDINGCTLYQSVTDDIN